jgi:hypothetical protein
MHQLVRSSQLRAQLRLTLHVPECPEKSHAKKREAETCAKCDLKKRTQLQRQTPLSAAFERRLDTSTVSYITPKRGPNVPERAHEKFVKLGKLSHLK